MNGGTNNADNPSSYTVESQTISLFEPEKIGYRFLGWYSNENKITEIPQNYNKNITLNAKWAIDTDSTCFSFDFENGYEITGFKDESVTSIMIPDYVTAIYDYAFTSNLDIETVVFAENIKCKTIGEYSFNYCETLKEISIPASVEVINRAAFYMCSALENVSFENGSSLKTIGDAAFSNCSAIKKIEIPSSVTSIGASSFNGCNALENIIFESGSNLATIGEYAFSICQSIKEIQIASSVKEIKSGAFMSCTQLEKNNFRIRKRT